VTEQQLERAVRELCRLRGIDPDRMVAHGADPIDRGDHCFVPAVLLHSPAWQRVAREVITWDQVRQAIGPAELVTGG
jgi:hypothetical protein